MRDAREVEERAPNERVTCIVARARVYDAAPAHDRGPAAVHDQIGPKHPTASHGDVLTAVSAGLVALLKEFYGKGPTQAKSYYQDDLVVCVLRGGFSRVEQTLLEGGRGAAVIQQRMEFQELMRDRFISVIEDATGRSVIGFMSGNEQNPDLMCEVFILAPTDLLDADPAPTA
jgi:uncharacterized protein YbcI